MQSLTYKINKQSIIVELLKYNILPIPIALLLLYLDGSLSYFNNYKIFNRKDRELIHKNELNSLYFSDNDYTLIINYFDNINKNVLDYYIINSSFSYLPTIKELQELNSNSVLLKSITNLVEYFNLKNKEIPLELGLAYLFYNKNLWMSANYSNIEENSVIFYLMVDRNKFIQTSSRFSGPYNPLYLPMLLTNKKNIILKLIN